MKNNKYYLIKTIRDIKKTNSSNEKIKILTELLENSKKENYKYYISFLHYVYDTTKYIYGIKNIKAKEDIEQVIKELNTIEYLEKNILIDIIDLLDKLNDRLLTGNNARDEIHKIMSYSLLHKYLLSLALKRTLDCGMSIKNINKSILNSEDIIYEFKIPLAGGSKHLDKITYPAYAQLKGDGKRTLIFYKNNNNILFLNRSGKHDDILKSNEYLKKLIIEHLKPGYVYDGEAIIYDKKLQYPLPRKISNGLLSRKKIDDDISNRIVLLLWDMIPIDIFMHNQKLNNRLSSSNNLAVKTYKERFLNLQKLLNKVDNNLKLIPSAIVHNEEEAMNIAKNYIKNGYEGAIIKNMNVSFESKRTNNMIKLKGINEIDLIVYDIIEGTGKYKNHIGALHCKSLNGKIKCSVGSGLSDKQRKIFYYDNTKILNKIITIKYNELIQNENNKDLYQLYLPRFVEIRTDKTLSEADTYEKATNEAKVKFKIK